MERVQLCGMTDEEIYELIGPEGFTYSHAVKICHNIYKKKTGSVSEIQGLPAKLRQLLGADSVYGLYAPYMDEKSSDGTVKYLFSNEKGQKFETVYIPDNKRNTVCVSTQSGCRMGCPFCVTALYGFHGNLSAGDILNQVLSIPEFKMVTNVVFMGMGEPMDNLANVLKACRIITSEWGMSLSSRNVTVSTVGITPPVIEFLKSSACNLVVSLYSPFPEERNKVIPAEKKYPVKDIIRIMRDMPVMKKRRLSLAYVMIENINDTDRHLEKIKSLLTGSGIRINLLSYHQVPGDINSSSKEERMLYFKHNLMISGISASIRKSRGKDISAACGLLAYGIMQNS